METESNVNMHTGIEYVVSLIDPYYRVKLAQFVGGHTLTIYDGDKFLFDVDIHVGNEWYARNARSVLLARGNGVEKFSAFLTKREMLRENPITHEIIAARDEA